MADLNSKIRLGTLVADEDGVVSYADKIFYDAFKADIPNAYDVPRIGELLRSGEPYTTFFAREEKEDFRYYRLDNLKANDKHILLLSDVTYIMRYYKYYQLSNYIVENNIMPVLWVKEDGTIIYHNKATKRYIPDDELDNKKVYRIASDIKKSDWEHLWEKVKKSETVVFTHRFYHKEEDVVFVFRVSANLAKYQDTQYCYMIITDITELVETNLKLVKEKEKATESEKLKSAFLLNMSHEIRTPMNAIVGFSEIIHENVDESMKEYTKIITQNVDYLLSIIDNIITISKIDSNQVKPHYNKFDVMDVLEDIKFNFELKLKKGDKNLSIIIDNHEGYIINSDRYIIEEIINRAVDNAIKFTDNGDIHIGYNVGSDTITFYVTDGGIGIANQYHDIIFDRFRQIDKHTLGSGLGLAIFAEYVGVIGGKYKVESESGRGTKISFTIDLDGAISEERRAIKKMDYLKLNGKKILVAEDIVVNQLMIYDMLTPYEVEVIRAMDGKECIEKFFKTKNVDIVLMDLDMPDIDGYEAASIIREVNRDVPIIAQSAYAQKENREKAKRVGINDFVTKPITKENLIRAILKNLK